MKSGIQGFGELRAEFERFPEDFNELPLRERAFAVVQLVKAAKAFGTNLVPGNSGLERCRNYLIQRVGEPVHTDELLAVSGIQEYARRIRELRVERGYQIECGKTLEQHIEAEMDLFEVEGSVPLKPLEYRLNDVEPDLHQAARWQTSNSIRRSETSVQDRILQLFLSFVGQPINGEELIYVAKGKTEWARRTRELRTEQGWLISTHYNGRPDLAPGVYVLETKERAPIHDRKIPDPVRRAVLQRDGYRCQECDWHHDLWVPEDARRLELHHVHKHVDGGANEEANLLTLCNICHDRYHDRSERL